MSSINAFSASLLNASKQKSLDKSMQPPIASFHMQSFADFQAIDPKTLRRKDRDEKSKINGNNLQQMLENLSFTNRLLGGVDSIDEDQESDDV